MQGLLSNNWTKSSVSERYSFSRINAYNCFIMQGPPSVDEMLVSLFRIGQEQLEVTDTW
jgi:hypothetical protein